MAVRSNGNCVSRFLVALLFTAFGSAGASRGQTITEFPIPTPGAGSLRIALGPDGNLWFTESRANKIGRITPSGEITEFPAPAAGGYPAGICAGPDGNLWFAENGSNRIGRITPQGSITEFPIPNAFPLGGPAEITTGPDGNLWFTETDGGVGGRVRKVTVSGQFTEFPPPQPSSSPHEITAGADGNLWTTLTFAGRIARVTPAGVMTEFATPSPSGMPLAIVAGPDGRIWFGEDGGLGHRVGRIDSNGAIIVFPVSNGLIGGMASGPGGQIWLTETAGVLGSIVPSTGAVTEIALPPGSDPWSIVAGPGNTLWMAEENANKIVRFSPDVSDCAQDSSGKCTRLAPVRFSRPRPAPHPIPPR